jgi:hypothetical protein
VSGGAVPWALAVLVAVVLSGAVVYPLHAVARTAGVCVSLDVIGGARYDC